MDRHYKWEECKKEFSANLFTFSRLILVLWDADQELKTRHTIGLGMGPFLFFCFNDPEDTKKRGMDALQGL